MGHAQVRKGGLQPGGPLHRRLLRIRALPHPGRLGGVARGAGPPARRLREARPLGRRSGDAHQAVGACACPARVLGAAEAGQRAALLSLAGPARRLGRHQGQQGAGAAQGGDHAGGAGHRSRPGQAEGQPVNKEDADLKCRLCTARCFFYNNIECVPVLTSTTKIVPVLIYD